MSSSLVRFCGVSSLQLPGRPCSIDDEKNEVPFGHCTSLVVGLPKKTRKELRTYGDEERKFREWWNMFDREPAEYIVGA
jgi:hypothetical protein